MFSGEFQMRVLQPPFPHKMVSQINGSRISAPSEKLHQRAPGDKMVQCHWPTFKDFPHLDNHVPCLNHKNCRRFFFVKLFQLVKPWFEQPCERLTWRAQLAHHCLVPTNSLHQDLLSSNHAPLHQIWGHLHHAWMSVCWSLHQKFATFEKSASTFEPCIAYCLVLPIKSAHLL